MEEEGRDSQYSFDQWYPLVHHVATRRFPWAGASPDDQSRIRGLERDDLIQEGCLALMHAIEKYNDSNSDGASFKTYAYNCIYNRMLQYVQDNSTPLKTRAKRAVQRSGTEKAKEKLQRALRCCLFSDLPQSIVDFPDVGDKHASPGEESEFVASCMEKLRAGMDPRLLGVLLDKARGLRLTTLGEVYGCSTENARLLVRKARVAAAAILHREVTDYEWS